MGFDIALFIIFLGFSFFCSGSETSLFSLSILTVEDLRRKHPGRGGLIVKLLDHPQKLLISVLMCNIFATMIATMAGTRIFEAILPLNGFIKEIVEIILISLFVLMIGELSPKTLAMSFAPQISLAVAPVFYFLTFILTPFIWAFRKVVKLLVYISSKLFFINIHEDQQFKTDEVIEVIKESQKHGVIDSEEGAILGNVIQFVNYDIWELARPRNQMFSISIDMVLSDIYELIKEKKYSRIPIWEDTEENIVGILHIKDLLQISSTKRKLSYYKNILRKPFFVPESIKAEKLLRDFQTTQNHLAVVIDEYGGISGIITLEDVLEAIIGDVVDKDDVKPLYYKYNSSMIEVEGHISIDELNKIFRTDMYSDSSTTIAGYILENIRKIPYSGETFILDDLKFKISGAKPNKIEKVLITKIKKNKSGKE